MVEKLIGCRDCGVDFRKWKLSFTKENMSANDDFSIRNVIAFIATMIRRITKKDAWC